MLGGNNRNRTRKRRFGAAGCAVATVIGLTAAPAAADGDGLPDLRPEQWGLVSIGAQEEWAVTQGQGAVVALPGVPVPEEHPDLVDNVRVDTEFGANEGDLDEGTALAVLVASHGHGRDAEGGVLGVAPEAGLLVLPTDDALPDAVRYAADEGAHVILLPEAAGTGATDGAAGPTGTTGAAGTGTAGGTVGADGAGEISAVDAPDDDLRAATREATESGVLVVGPAGGDDPSVLSVAGVDENGALIPDSPATQTIELTAPGADLAVADADGGQDQVTGTPYAAAMAAGAAALLRAEYPRLSVEQIRQSLVEGSQEGPDGLPTLHLPSAQAQAAESAGGVPLEDLADRADQGPRVPLWAWFASIGAVLVLGVLLAVVWVRRSTADPYGVREERREEEEGIAAERGREAGEQEPPSRRKGGRRRKPRGR
ncbi:S8 family serine peptidase [Nocardiopsis sp. EMB25]|uniref:S8 family serine peptidase n=1 Tax=Nocardiopsis sp. EMB25 TaxID=2835867 RepID=UPI002284DC1A|nr:S8 family serine peptidase [Nocardiopsis sp. EMB25]MCY9786064.1 S8 family serine peptidase [Nocardiopsis sp. EMB25]